MSAQQVDDYLAAIEEPKRTTLDSLRQTIRELVPRAEECMSYGMPAYKLEGKTIAGFVTCRLH